MVKRSSSKRLSGVQFLAGPHMYKIGDEKSLHRFNLEKKITKEKNIKKKEMYIKMLKTYEKL